MRRRDFVRERTEKEKQTAQEVVFSEKLEVGKPCPYCKRIYRKAGRKPK